MTPAENLASVAETGDAAVAPAAEAAPFVINLCSSSTPMALPHADRPDLKRFTFFVSRRFEEGRERFRLHMGFFESLAEAENWLAVVREIYPGAWAGEAPGKKLRARAVAAAAAQAAHATGPHSLAASAEPEPAPAAPATEPPAAPAAGPATSVPTLQPAAPASAAKPAQRVRPPVTAATAARAAKPVAAKAVAAPTPRPAAAKPAGKADATAIFDNSNIKEVLAALDESADATGEPRSAPVRQVAGTLTEAQALQYLEGRAPAEAVKPAAFAVQLQWSVQPIAHEKLPPLAIFSAYSLYCVEGSREGRKWYGLRLGFFNDAISAKQVAGYVRSEFGSAAVVPVSAAERQRVSGDKGAIPLRAPRKAPESVDHEFKLFDANGPQTQSAPVRELRPIPFEPRTAGPRKVVHARERRAPQTLEETLEILGANDLTIDDGKGGAVAGVGAGPSRKAEKSTPFTRLLERLGERVRKN